MKILSCIKLVTVAILLTLPVTFASAQKDEDIGNDPKRPYDTRVIRDGRPTPTPKPSTTKPGEKPQGTPAPQASKVERRGETTTRRTTPSRSSSARSSASTKTSGFISTFTMQPNLDTVVLYFQPLDVKKKVGEEFVTAISVMNKATRSFDRLFLVIGYDPAYLYPLGVKDDWLRALSIEPARAEVYYDKGKIIYTAQLKQSIAPASQKMLFIKWRTLKPTDFTQIEFAAYEDNFTSLLKGSEDILGEAQDTRDGVIPASIMISSPDKVDEADLPNDIAFDGYLEGGYMSVPEFEYGMNLCLIPEKRYVKQGEEFLVHIYLENKEELPADNLNLLLSYDPGILEILDYDEGNWITRGINIFDGMYHETFPFDYQLRNLVDPGEGTIKYKMAASNPKTLSRSGTLATIRARAISTTGAAAIQFVMPEKTRDGKTGVTFMNQDMLGSPDKKSDGIINCRVIVQ